MKDYIQDIKTYLDCKKYLKQLDSASLNDFYQLKPEVFLSNSFGKTDIRNVWINRYTQVAVSLDVRVSIGNVDWVSLEVQIKSLSPSILPATTKPARPTLSRSISASSTLESHLYQFHSRDSEQLESIEVYTIEQPLNTELEVDGVKFTTQFYNYQEKSLARFQEMFKKNEKIDMNKDLQELLGMSGIIHLPKIRQQDQKIKEFISSSTLSNLRKSLLPSTKVRFPREVVNDIQIILEEFVESHNIEEAQDKLYAVRIKTKDIKAKRLIKFISELLDELPPVDMKISKMFLSCSFVHGCIKHLFKINTNIVCRCSNTVTDKHKDLIWRPDYLIDMFTTDSSEPVPIVYGEVKSESAKSASIQKDIYRLAILSKRKLEEGTMKQVTSFLSVGSSLKNFTTINVHSKLFAFFECAEITLATRIDNVVGILSFLDTLYDLANTFEGRMSEYDTNPITIEKTKTLPLQIYSQLLGEDIKDTTSTSSNRTAKRRLS